ncbi:MAG TPA: isoprenylcysteine carboxylmethyltransferase family protein, partial [Acidobacteriota bacterium]|nr:isoprenylcysteine carboxylmethyltransferase family protein [Acidobacteriota bacterium]
GIYPNQPANQIVAHGPFRFSRNPMYVAMTALTIGVSLLSNIGWILVFIPFILFALTMLVIRREEAYLTDAFGESYAQYCARVRRWI